MKESTHKLAFYAIGMLFVLIVVSAAIQHVKIDFRSITFLEGLATFFVTVALYTAIEMIVKKYNNDKDK